MIALAELELLGHLRRAAGGRYVPVRGEPRGPYPPARWTEPARELHACCRSPARTPAAAPASRPTSRRSPACGVHGMTAITAITAQNTVGVTAVEAVAPAMIVAQVRAVVEDIGVDAVKIGMLGDADTIAAVERALDLCRPGTPIVVDPVMVAESGRAAARARRARRAGRAHPDACDRRHPEPGRGARADGRAGGRRARARARGARARPAASSSSPAATATRPPTSSSTATSSTEIAGERHPDGAAHGSGCTHSSALAARLALGDAPLEAARAARAIAGAAAVRDGLRDVGAGARAGGRARYRRPGDAARRRSRARESRLSSAIIGGEVPAHEARTRRGPDRRGRRRGRRGGAGADRGVPPPARPGHVGRGAHDDGLRPPRGRDGSSRFEDVPRDAERVIFFPRAAGGARSRARRNAARARCHARS